MKIAVTAMLTAAIALASNGPTIAEPNYPVFVTISGQGAIRFILGAGRSSTCERGGLFDGWLAPGTYRFDTTYTSVCYRHTSGYFRELNWSPRYTAPTQVGWPIAPRPVEIVIYTD